MVITGYEEIYKKEVIQLILHIQNNEAGINLSLQEQPDLYDIQTSYMKDGGYFWVALNDKKEVIGTIALMRKGNGVGILKKFFVRKDYRSQKVGLKLYLALLDFSEDKGFTTLLLDTPSVAKDSHRFYEKNGFVRITTSELPIPYEFPDRDSYLYIKRLTS
ncbi:MAG: GNAT family N-acetyltransferase [Clostridium sp.]|nr:GNAT family N-acetyltransferase [Clostridium sp.]